MCLVFIPDSLPPSPFGDAQHGWLLHLIGAPQPLLALLGLALLPSITFCAPPSISAHPLPTQHSTSGTAPFWVAHLFFLQIHPIAFQTPFWFTMSKPLNPNHSDITNQAKQHWNSISPACQAQIILKYMGCLQPLCAVDELCVPAFVSPDEMGDLVDDIEAMFNWYHSIAQSGYCFACISLQCLITHNFLSFSLM